MDLHEMPELDFSIRAYERDGFRECLRVLGGPNGPFEPVERVIRSMCDDITVSVWREALRPRRGRR